MKCQRVFSGENKKNVSKCRLLKFLPSMLIVKKNVFALLYGNGFGDSIKRLLFTSSHSLKKTVLFLKPYEREED